MLPDGSCIQAGGFCYSQRILVLANLQEVEGMHACDEVSKHEEERIFRLHV